MVKFIKSSLYVQGHLAVSGRAQIGNLEICLLNQDIILPPEFTVAFPMLVAGEHAASFQVVRGHFPYFMQKFGRGQVGLAPFSRTPEKRLMRKNYRGTKYNAMKERI